MHDIQVFLNFAKFYWCFIQGFSKIVRPLTLMLKTSPILIVLQLLLDVADNNEIGGVEGSVNEINLSNLFTFKNFIRAGYLTSNNAKKNDGNSNRNADSTKNGVKIAWNSNYLTLDVKKTFNLLRHAFT